MRLLCVSCDVEFEAEPGGRPRCPSCRRVHGLEEVRTGAGGRRRLAGPALALAAVAAGIGGWIWWAGRTPQEMPDAVPGEPLAADDLRAFLTDRGVASRDLVDPFAIDARLRAFAAKAVSGKSGDADRAEALFEALRVQGRDRGYSAFVGFSPISEEVRLPPSAWRQIGKKAGVELSSLELSLLYVAAAREVDVPAMVVELHALPDERSPVDPTGYYGHFAAGVFPGGDFDREPTVWDLHLGRRLTAAREAQETLDDVSVAAQVYSHRAMATLIMEGDSARAVDLAEQAGRLAPRSVSILGAHGVVLIATGGIREGMDLLQRALRRRNDAARHHNLATALLTARDGEGAMREVSEALRRAPEFAAAHATLAAIHLSSGRADQAAEELAIARGIDSDLDMLPLLEANLHLARHDLDRALTSAQEAVRRREHDERALLTLATIHRERGEILAMRRALRRAVEESHRPEEIRAAVEQMFGPTALEEDVDDDPADAGAAPGNAEAEGDAGPSSGFQLESKILQGREPSLQLGDPSKLRLRGGGSGFQLKLR